MKLFYSASIYLLVLLGPHYSYSKNEANLNLVGGIAFDEICIQNFKDIHLTENLRLLSEYFTPSSVTKYVNQTQGSYFEIDTKAVPMTITFLTSGLFDLTLIRRHGVIEFCDDGRRLVVKGIGRNDPISLSEGTITFGAGGAKLIFTRGDKPTQLRKLAGED